MLLYERACISIENISRLFTNAVGVQSLDGIAREKRPFSIDMDALRATNNRFIMICIIFYPELRLTDTVFKKQEYK
jgi:hypothetical protein